MVPNFIGSLVSDRKIEVTGFRLASSNLVPTEENRDGSLNLEISPNARRLLASNLDCLKPGALPDEW